VIPPAFVIPELFDALSESAIWFRPVKNAPNDVADFEIGYCNHAACVLLDAPKEQIIGQKLLHTTLVDDDYKRVVFNQCLTVWQTGRSHEESFHSRFLGKYFTALRSRLMDGVISVVRDRTDYYKAEKERQEEAKKYTAILDASADGVMLLKAIRNPANEIVDFQLTHCNKAAFRLGALPPGSINKTLLEILPHLKGSEQLERHKQVIETGIPFRMETTFRDPDGQEYGWFIVSLEKTGEHVVSTFVDISDKKKNEEKIEEQTNLLNSNFDAAINAIFACEALHDDKGEIVDFEVVKINQAFTRMIGVTAQQAEGTCYNQLFPAGKEYGFFDMYCQVVETGNSMRKEKFYQSDQLTGWYDVSAVKRGDNGIVITFTDVTQSKTDKKAVEEAARYLQDVIDCSQTGIILLSPVTDEKGDIIDFRFKTVNNTVSQFAGTGPADLAGKLHNEVFPLSLQGGLFEKYKEIAKSDQAEQRFESYLTINEQDMWIDVLVKKRNEDLLITIHDFTPQKKLQVEIADTVEKLNTVINTSRAGMFTFVPVYNPEGEIDDFRFNIVNQSVAAYIGQTAENLAGGLGSAFFPDYRTNGLFDIYKDTYLHNKPHEFDFHYVGAFDVYFNIYSVKACDEVLVTFTDYTSRKQLQLQLEATIDELKKSNSNLEEFAYAASHDLQEPLRKINYFSERLRKDIGQKLTPEESHMFGRMESATRRMSQLISDLLTYSQVSRNLAKFKPVDLHDVAKQVLADLETSIAEKKAVINLQTLPTVHGDAVQLGQLFQNLISNSLKYSKKEINPVINITAAEVYKTVDDVPKAFCQLHIQDNGIGFEQEHADKIFKVFQRLHGQSEYPGTGIGLAIVHKVIENHDGDIKAQSQVGIGSSFTILLPQA